MKTKLFLSCFLLLTFNLLLVATATVRYVSKTGNSTPPYTSWATGSDSIQKCINICQNGDTVYVANGVYKENLVVNSEIALIGSSMDSTVIDGLGLGDRTIITNVNASILNFTINGRGAYIISAWALTAYDYIQIRNCRITKAGGGIGIIRYSSEVNNVIMNEILRGYDAGCYSDTCLGSHLNNSVIIVDQNWADAVHIDIGGIYYLKNNILIFNHQFNNPGYGISLSWPKQIYVFNNLISGFQNNIYIDLLEDTVFIKNNVLAYKKWSSLESDGSIYTRNDKAVIKNNIFINNSNSAVSGYIPYVNLDYNLYWNNDNDLYGINYGEHDIAADPMFVKDTVPSPKFNYDYHLQAFSPGIDKGDPSILDKDGSRSDIGMYGGPFGEIYTYHDLAPKPPSNLTASVQGKAVTLKWNKNTEADLFRYRVYRDTIPNFIYDTTKIITVTADTFFVDILGDEETPNQYFYKITAIDSAINQSAASEEVQVTLTGMPEMPPIVVEEYKLLQNYPNPFNPSTTIPYRLKSPAYVKIMVYNILGELVRVLVNQYQSAGYYEVDFAPNSKERKKGTAAIREFETGYYGDIVSGIYLYRIEVIGDGNIPVFSDMKKMMMVK